MPAQMDLESNFERSQMGVALSVPHRSRRGHGGRSRPDSRPCSDIQ